MTYTTFDWKEPEEPADIVEALRLADAEQRRQLEGAMVMNPQSGPSLFARAASEIERLRRVLDITEN